VTVQQKPILHGRDHACGGADPVPGICLLSPGSDIDDVLRATGVGAFWKLDEPSGTVAHDSSGNGWDLNVPSGKSPPTWGQPAGPPGTPSAKFTLGVDDMFARTASPSFPAYLGDLTAAGWVNLADSGADAHYLMGQGDPMGITNDGWALLVGGTATLPAHKAFVLFNDGTGAPSEIDGNDLLVTNGTTWYFLAVVRDAGEFKLYVDGLLQAATSSAAYAAAGGFKIGDVRGTSTGIENYDLQGLASYFATWSRALTSTELLEIKDATASHTGEVLTIGPDGTPIWTPPKVSVGVNGDPGTQPAPTPDPPPPLADPPTYWGATTDWINDQPFTYGGSPFTVQPNTWTPIPFTSPLMERQSNVHSVGTLFQEIAWNSPDAAGWINPGDPHAIVIPHDMPINEGAGSPHGMWFQICLRLDVPAVELTTSRRALRVFETTHQKPVVEINTWRNTIDLGGGSFDVIHGTGPTTDAIFANGNPGGTTTDIHEGTAFAPNDMTRASFFDWLPTDTAGNKILKKGMRLVAQVWHNAASPLTFNAGGTYSGTLDGNYKPHFLVFASMDRAWGAPWSTWPPP
jgi:hypothetical protein